MSYYSDAFTEEDLDQIEEKLLKEDEEKRKEEMMVSGKGVFDLDRLKREKHQDK
ncbi:MAG: hypothetical protein BWY19_00371 [bacterium ADurb.Bin212]|nr:MAG: hypothetical protein BWY19_00371 [bacterium ADurb.Bin212]